MSENSQYRSHGALRMSATGEKWTTAKRNAQECWTNGPSVLPGVSPDQRWLEAQLLGEALFVLKSAAVGPRSEPGQDLPQVEPHADHLLVKFDPAMNLSHLAARILPSTDERHRYAGGIPGLRFSTEDRRVSLYIPGLDCKIVLGKGSKKVWLRAVSDVFSDTDPSFLLWSQSPNVVTRAEKDWLNEWSPPSPRDDAASILLRRVRALEILKPLMVSAWPGGRQRLQVEVWVTQHDPQLAAQFIEIMTDPRLTPHLQLVERYRTWLEFESPSGDRIVVRVELDPRSTAAA